MGWVKRWLWLFLECELTKLTNGTHVTLGSLEYDLLKGNATATNVILHQPKRDDWKWDSPLLARVGRIYIEVNVPNLLYQILISLVWTFKPPGSEPQSSIEIYSVLLWDAQVFIERRQFVFNFYLLDQTLELPDASEILGKHKHPEQEEMPSSLFKQHKKSNKKKPKINTSVINDPVLSDNTIDNDNDGNSSIATDVSKEHAHQLVNQMFSAVNSLSRAAQQGSLKQQLLEQKNKFADRLKEIRNEHDVETSKVANTVQQGARVMRHMSKAVVTKTQGVKVLPQVPKKKPSFFDSAENTHSGESSTVRRRRRINTDEAPEEGLPPYVRVGRVVLKDVRIFTRYNWDDEDDNSHNGVNHDVGDDIFKITGEEEKVEEHHSSSSDNESDDDEHDEEFVETTQDGVEISTSKSSTTTATARKPTKSGWNKPIYLNDVTVRASELCPPMSLMDPETKLPAIYQRLDRVIDVVFKRILTEIAKSNTGKLLNTAMGELTSFIQLSNVQQKSKPTSSTNSTHYKSKSNSSRSNNKDNETSITKLGEHLHLQ